MSTKIIIQFTTIVQTDPTWTEEDGETSIASDGQLGRLADANPATGLQKPGTHTDTGDLAVKFKAKIAPLTGATIPVGYAIKGVRVVGAARVYPAYDGVLITLGMETDDFVYPDHAQQSPLLTPFTPLPLIDFSLAMPQTPEADIGVPWDTTLIGQIVGSLQLSNSPITVDDSVLYNAVVGELYVEVEVIAPPAVSALAPTSGYVDDVTQFSWSWLGSGEGQKRFELKVWTVAVAEGMGFDPDSSPYAYRVQGGSATSLSAFLNSHLSRGVAYYWSVRAAKDLNGADWWSPWPTPLEVTYNAPPVVTVDAPVDPLTLTTRPLVQWTSADAQFGTLGAAWEARIYKEPDAGWPVSGLPAVPPFDSSSGADNAKEWRVVRQLDAQETFRAYVRVKAPTTSRSAGLWSAWAFREFFADLDVVGGPAFTAAYDDPPFRTHMVLTTGIADTDVAVYQLTRSTDAGASWATFVVWSDVSGDWALTPTERMFFGDASTPHDLYDQDIVLGNEIRYRAVEIIPGDDGDLSSSPTEVDLPAQIPPCRVMLADPLVLGQPLPVQSQDSWLSVTTDVPAGAFKPLGRTRFVVQQGLVGGDTLTLNLIFTTLEERAGVLALLTSGVTMILMTEQRNRFVRVAGDLAHSEYLWDLQFGALDTDKVAVPLVEVEDPRL